MPAAHVGMPPSTLQMFRQVPIWVLGPGSTQVAPRAQVLIGLHG